MKKIIYILPLLLLFSCKTENNKLPPKEINYSNVKQLDSLIKITSKSNDSIFLGFKLGTNKNGFKSHIKALAKEDIHLVFSEKEVLNTYFGNLYLEDTYKFNTRITSNRINGNGTYFIKPHYKEGFLNRMEIMSFEKWDNGGNPPSWLLARIKENTNELEDSNLKRQLINFNFIGENDYIGTNNNYFVFKNGIIINYIEKKELYQNILDSINFKKRIKVKNKNIKV